MRDKLVDEKRAALSPADREILDSPKRQALGPSRLKSVIKLEPKVLVSDREVAERIARDEPAKKNQALQLASEIERQDKVLQFTINYKRDANYDYWKTRAEFEQTPSALTARTRMFEARKAFRDADLPTAKRLYQEGFKEWRAVIDKFPSILDDDETTGSDLLDFIKRYRTVLDQLDEKLGEDFPLWEVIEKFDRENDFPEELKEHRARQGRPLPEDSAAKKTEPEAAPTPAPGENPPPSDKAEAKAKPAENSEVAPKPAPQDEKSPPADSGKK